MTRNEVVLGFEQWNRDTGALPHGGSWMYEIQAFIDAAYAAGMERAAEICEAQGRMAESIDGNSFYIALGQAANAIRAEIKGE